MEQQQPSLGIIDKSRDRVYFTILPNVIWQKGLTAIEFALYSAIKRVAGDKGECYMGTRRLAQLAGIGAGSVSRAKKVLATKDLIAVVSKKRTKTGQPVDHIIVLDIWEENMRAFVERSTLEHQRSTLEHQRSTGEPEEEPLKNNNEEEHVVVTEDDLAQITRLYEQTCGMLSPIMAEMMHADMQRFPNLDWWGYAFQAAAQANARNYRYVIKVVERVAREGIGPPKGRDEDMDSREKRRERYMGGKYAEYIQH